MALIKCPECGKEKVSDTADSCPECGFGIKSYYNDLKNEEAKRLNIEKKKEDFLQSLEMPEEPVKEMCSYETRQVLIGVGMILFGGISALIYIQGRVYSIPFLLFFFILICIGISQIYNAYSSLNIRYKQLMEVYNESLKDESKYKQNKLEEFMEIENYIENSNNERILNNNEEKKIKCPKCGSTQITAGKRGYKVTTGMIGSSTVLNTCMKCGHQWKPGGYRYL